ncbi:hypothetical protein [Ideonella sp. A 288]|uniref:hypothetical protein n=1 Tax=Ideonella sp. A 288 TaxID=1962181 RepID=UPI000B4B956B|nr:hypothetical protein [Ideonella sp. A 288]
MQVWLRLMIVWFIALALPVQGMAGAAMMHCGPGHHGPDAALTMPHDHGSAHGSAHDEGATAHHHAAMADSADLADATASPQDKAPSGAVTDLSKAKCSACAACCASAALPSASAPIAQSANAPTVFAEALVTVDAFASDGPDRPPRPLLA